MYCLKYKYKNKFKIICEYKKQNRCISYNTKIFKKIKVKLHNFYNMPQSKK